MELVVALAIAILGIIFSGSVVALVLICRHRFCSKDAADEKPILKFCKEECASVSTASAGPVNNDLDDVLQLSPNIEKLLKEKSGVQEASGLVENCLAILRTCHWVTDKLSGLSFSPIHGNQLVMDEVRLATQRVMPRVDDLIRAMYMGKGKSVQAPLLEARAAALILATNNLVLAFRAAYPTAVENVEWLRIVLSDLELHLKRLREVAQCEEMQSIQKESFASSNGSCGTATTVQRMSVRLSVVLTLGLPGVGKTTLCRRLCQHYESQAPPFDALVHVCYDAFLTNVSDYNEERRLLFQCCRALCQLVTTGGVDDSLPEVHCDLIGQFEAACMQPVRQKFASSGRHFSVLLLIDDNMHLRSMRHQYYQLARQMNAGYGLIAFPVDLPLAIRRNANRSDDCKVDEGLIHQMAAKFDWPSDDSAERANMMLLGGGSWPEISCVVAFLKSTFEERNVPKRLLPRVNCSQPNEEGVNNALYQCDCMLRKIVNDMMKRNVDDGGTMTGAALSKAKCEVLKRLRGQRVDHLLSVDHLTNLLVQRLLDQGDGE